MAEWIYAEFYDEYILCESVESGELYDANKHMYLHCKEIPNHCRLDEKDGKKYFDYTQILPRWVAATNKEKGEYHYELVDKGLRPQKPQLDEFDSEKEFQTVMYHWLMYNNKKSGAYWYSKSKELENKVAELFRSKGFQVSLTGGPNDQGIDLKATKNRTLFLVQCKGWSKRVGTAPIREAIGIKTAEAANFVVISPEGFSGPAMRLAREHDIILLDATGLTNIVRDRASPLDAANILSFPK